MATCNISNQKNNLFYKNLLAGIAKVKNKLLSETYLVKIFYGRFCCVRENDMDDFFRLSIIELLSFKNKNGNLIYGSAI